MSSITTAVGPITIKMASIFISQRATPAIAGWSRTTTSIVRSTNAGITRTAPTIASIAIRVSSPRHRPAHVNHNHREIVFLRLRRGTSSGTVPRFIATRPRHPETTGADVTVHPRRASTARTHPIPHRAKRLRFSATGHRPPQTTGPDAAPPHRHALSRPPHRHVSSAARHLLRPTSGDRQRAFLIGARRPEMAGVGEVHRRRRASSAARHPPDPASTVAQWIAAPARWIRDASTHHDKRA